VTALTVVPQLTSPLHSSHKAADQVLVVTDPSHDLSPRLFATTASAATSSLSEQVSSTTNPGGTTYFQLQEPSPDGPLTVKHWQSPSNRPLSCTTTPNFGEICVGPALPSPPDIIGTPPFLQP
ncbi:MAG: hypothetical protein ACYDB3_01045, partial [Acidimicrobiales bacterium]